MLVYVLYLSVLHKFLYDVLLAAAASDSEHSKPILVFHFTFAVLHVGRHERRWKGMRAFPLLSSSGERLFGAGQSRAISRLNPMPLAFMIMTFQSFIANL